MDTEVNIHIIIGSTRQNRFSDKPAFYLLDELNKYKDVNAEIIDLRDWELPFFNEPASPIILKGNYSNEAAKKWASKIGEADGYIIVTPEYNHGYPAVLKNALDWVYYEWNDKPVGFVGYGNTGGARSIEQLRQVVIELAMHPIRRSIHIPLEVYISTMNEKVPANPELFKPLREGIWGDHLANFFEELISLTKALKFNKLETQTLTL